MAVSGPVLEAGVDWFKIATRKTNTTDRNAGEGEGTKGAKIQKGGRGRAWGGGGVFKS